VKSEMDWEGSIMDLMDALRGRRAIREYTAEPLPRAVPCCRS
jgi:hypothetical protein